MLALLKPVLFLTQASSLISLPHRTSTVFIRYYLVWATMCEPNPLNDQSIRTSYERCQSKRQACILAGRSSPASREQCIRCVRAKVDCGFSQRAKSKPSGEDKTCGSLQEGLSENGEEVLKGVLESPSPIATFPWPLKIDIASWIPSTWYESIAFDPCFRESEDISDRDRLETWIHQEQGDAHADAYNPRSPAMTAGNNSAQNQHPSVSFSNNWAAQRPQLLTSYAPRPVYETGSSAMATELSNLLAEIHKTAKLLENTSNSIPWLPLDTDTCSARKVLRLGHRYAALLCNFRISDMLTSPPEKPDSNDPTSAGYNACVHGMTYRAEELSWPSIVTMDCLSAPAATACDAIQRTAAHRSENTINSFDMPTTLFVFGCYTSLMQLYLSVLD
jgi:hypothetical protein